MKALIFLCVILFISLLSCSKDKVLPPEESDSGSYEFTAKYDYIRSHPGGGGIFIVKISPDTEFTGSVKLSLGAGPGLNAQLSKTELTAADTVSEILLHPEPVIAQGTYKITLTSSHADTTKSIELEIDIIDWGSDNYETAIAQRNEFKDFLEAADPAYAELFGKADIIYQTYPQVLIVSHYTFIYADYELRLCYHNMIPPHDWYMVRIRKRNCEEPEFAARRETNGSIHEIPVSEYPKMFNY